MRENPFRRGKNAGRTSKLNRKQFKPRPDRAEVVRVSVVADLVEERVLKELTDIATSRLDPLYMHMRSVLTVRRR
jgi:hypothetical protein